MGAIHEAGTREGVGGFTLLQACRPPGSTVTPEALWAHPAGFWQASLQAELIDSSASGGAQPSALPEISGWAENSLPRNGSVYTGNQPRPQGGPGCQDASVMSNSL